MTRQYGDMTHWIHNITRVILFISTWIPSKYHSAHCVRRVSTNNQQQRSTTTQKLLWARPPAVWIVHRSNNSLLSKMHEKMLLLHRTQNRCALSSKAGGSTCINCVVSELFLVNKTQPWDWRAHSSTCLVQDYRSWERNARRTKLLL